MKNFNVATETTAISATTLTVGQTQKATAFNVTRVLKLDRDAMSLPNYIVNACREAGYTVKQIGRTTHVSSVWGLIAI
jgi:hypothetical protein